MINLLDSPTSTQLPHRESRLSTATPRARRWTGTSAAVVGSAAPPPGWHRPPTCHSSRFTTTGKRGLHVCRWLAYFGDPIRPEELLYEPRRSLIEQSRRSGPDANIANADGFGLGWYGLSDAPGLFRSSSPAWGDQNLRELSAQIRSPLFLAHIRAASAGMPVQQTNCHPFKHGKWLFVHNGFIADWPHLRRELTMAVDPELYPFIEGSTDSEVMF